MNIGIVTTWFERGAAYVSRQYRDTLRREHDVYIFARAGETYGRGDPEWDDPSVTWADVHPLVAGTTLVDLKQFRDWLSEKRIQLVLFNEQTWWHPVVLCNRLGVITGAYVDYYTEDTIPLFDCYDFLLCNTQRHASVFDRHPACKYVPWGTNLQKITYRGRDLVDPECVTFFHSCGMSPDRKGTDIFILALKELPRMARGVIHSQVPVRGELPHLANDIDALERAGQLVCIERPVPLPGLYHLGDVYVYPTRLEGIGLTIAEALAAGMPVIAPDHPPMTEFVKSGINGSTLPVRRLFARSDGYYWPQCLVAAEDLAETMNAYLTTRETLPDKRDAARFWAETHLNWPLNSEHLAEYLSGLRKRPFNETEEANERALQFDRRHVPFLLLHPRVHSFMLKAKKPLSIVRPALRSWTDPMATL